MTTGPSPTGQFARYDRSPALAGPVTSALAVPGLSAALDHVGYGTIAALSAVENVLPPVPSEVVLPLVGAQVSAGHLLFWAAVLASTIGSVLGSYVPYALGRWGGRPLVLRLPR